MTNLIKRNNDNTLDLIKLSITPGNDVTLTPKQEEKKFRLIKADEFTYLHKSRSQVIAWLVEYFGNSGRIENYSKRTAERDYYDAMRVIGYTRKLDKEYKRVFYAEQLEERMRKMKSDRDYINATKVLVDLLMLNKEDEAPPQVNLDIPDIFFSADIEILDLPTVKNLEEKKNALLKKKRRDKEFSYLDLVKEEAEDIQIEEDVD